MRTKRAKFDAVFFDLDGLMVDTSHLYLESEQEIVSQFNKSIPTELYNELLGRKPIDACTLIVEELELPISPEEFLRQRDEIMERKMESHLEAKAGLKEIITQFSGKIPMAIVTSSDKKFLLKVVEKLKLKRKFKIFQSSEGIRNGKPHPEIYVTAAAKMGVYASAVIALEDSVNGCRSAYDAGCYTVAIPSPLDIRENFEFVDYIAEDLIEARDHIHGILSRPVF